MENGFFLRDNLDGYKEYDCPNVEVPSGLKMKINKVYQPVKAVLMMVNSKTMDAFWNVVEELA